jgi:hypothetical protein
MNSDTLNTILIACITSSGFWLLLQRILEEFFNKKKDTSKDNALLLGLAHDRIHSLANIYINRGWLTADEYENLSKYLYEPYTAKGGNGTGKRLMNEVNNLPIRSGSYEMYGETGDSRSVVMARLHREE